MAVRDRRMALDDRDRPLAYDHRVALADRHERLAVHYRGMADRWQRRGLPPAHRAPDPSARHLGHRLADTVN